jgi:hypothetical protein
MLQRCELSDCALLVSFCPLLKNRFAVLSGHKKRSNQSKFLQEEQHQSTVRNHANFRLIRLSQEGWAAVPGNRPGSRAALRRRGV